MGNGSEVVEGFTRGEAHERIISRGEEERRGMEERKED